MMRARGTRLTVRAAGLVFVTLALVLAVPTVGVAQGPSSPSPTVPRLPDVSAVDISISDLDEAPPAARQAILELAALGAYPLDAQMRAEPNLVLDQTTAAFMLVNVFSLRLGDEFPVPAAEALPLLRVITESSAAAADPMNVGQLLEYLLDFAALSGADNETLAATLVDRYPALQAGNLAAPITRAGAALMITIALQHLAGPPS